MDDNHAAAERRSWWMAAMLGVATSFAGSLNSAADDVADGKLIFNNACRTCHSQDAGDNRLGPHLAGIVGREAAAADGFAYSSSLKNSKFTWTAQKLDAFIANSEAVVPGNNMKPFSGIEDAKDRAKLIAYLESSQ